MAIVVVPITKSKGTVEFETETLPVEVYKEALLLGLKELANRGMSKLTKASFNGDEEALKAASQAQAEKNVVAINAGEIRFSGKKAKTGESAAVMTEAVRLAKALVKDAIKANGERINTYAARDITAMAKAYLDEDPSLVEQAKTNLEERAKKPLKVDIISKLGFKPDPKLVAKADAAKAKKKTQLSATQAGKVKVRARSGATAH